MYNANTTRAIKEKMKIGYLYLDPAEETVVECTKITKGKSWIKEIIRGKTNLYEGDGYLCHQDTFDDDSIKLHEIGPKENFPELLL